METKSRINTLLHHNFFKATPILKT